MLRQFMWRNKTLLTATAFGEWHWKLENREGFLHFTLHSLIKNTLNNYHFYNLKNGLHDVLKWMLLEVMKCKSHLRDVNKP